MSQPTAGGDYTADDVRLVSLNEAGLDSNHAAELREWVLEMIEGTDPLIQDNEDGPSFWEWINRHHREEPKDPLFDTYVLVDKADGRVVATASIVVDDRDVGRRHKIDGVWLGGMNVRRDLRKRDLGSVLMNILEGLFQKRSDETGMPLKVNLFTSPELAEKLAAMWSFETLGAIDIEETGNTEIYCRRVFRPLP